MIRTLVAMLAALAALAVAFAGLPASAQQDRAPLLRNARIFDATGAPAYTGDVLIRDGVIAEIATKLADQKLNINDIEVLKVREGEGGTIRLGFDSGEAAERSLEVLRGLGYQARRR